MRRIVILFVFLGLAHFALATHQRAGEITFRWKGELTYEFTILTYTYSLSPADRPSLEIFFGDGTSGIFPRVEKVDLPNDLRRNKYIGEHTYSGVGSYVVSLEDPNRNAGILNIPNSVNVPLYLETLLVINPFLAANNSPVLLLPPIDNGCTNFPYIHNPGAWDPDGDSLTYRLVDCRTAGGLPIAGYVLPNKTAGNSTPPDTICKIDPHTGEFLWSFPKVQGEYNIAILIEEWRNGFRIGYVTRDMQISITACNNHPPVIKPVPDTCVIAGSKISFLVEASDPDGQNVTLSGAGGPMMVPVSPATFPKTTASGNVSSVFNWNTICDHVQKSPYTMYFKAQDNGIPVNLVDIIYVNLTVIAPRIENLTATPMGNSIILHWDISPCANAIGYRIYRRSGFYGYVPAHCETGVPAYTGYQQIGQVNSLNTLTLTDDDQGSGLIHGVDYCYMVIAYFDDGAESIASEEVCVSLKRDLPIITNISIRNTDASQGSALIAWVKPTELDFTQTPGPFKYMIYRSTAPGFTWVLIDSLSGLADTVYIDSLLNTRDEKISYEIGLMNDTPGNRFLVGTTHPATSVFLNLIPSDRQITLSWSYSVPWNNDTTVIYRKDLVSGLFDSIGFTSGSSYTDSNLVNGTSYCYYVKTVGHYTDASLPAPLLNLSQQSCAIPVDNVPPCAPSLIVSVNCEASANTLNWTNPNESCASDTYMYYVYFKPQQGGDYVLTDSVFGAENTIYYHTQLNTVVGCYVVTARDTIGNQSIFSNEICISSDSCPSYVLPNVFTPNGDTRNDLFKPFPYNSVAKISLTIYNRWGSVVFTTEDPAINWDGKDKNSGQACSDGVYFYVCDVFEITLNGQQKRSLSGIVTIVTN